MDLTFTNQQLKACYESNENTNAFTNENKQQLVNLQTSVDITNNTWDLSKNGRQVVVADGDKVINITNVVDGVKALHIIHTNTNCSITISNKSYSIQPSTSKLSVVYATVIHNEIYLNNVLDEYVKVESINPPNEFPVENRIGLWTMSSINQVGNYATFWEDVDGGGLAKRFIKLSAQGPNYSFTDGISFENNENLYAEPDGLLLGTEFTMYALVKKTGNGGLFSLYAGPYFLYLMEDLVYFHTNPSPAQVNMDGVLNMADFKVIALTYNSGINAAKLYVDGIMVGNFSTPYNELNPCKLYGISGGLSDIFTGNIKGFTFFTGIHTPEQIIINSPLFKTIAES